MSQLVTVVCRHNQARSVMGAAALRRYFPEFDVASAGIEAIEGQRIPDSILNLADNWGLDVQDLYSHGLQSVQQRLQSSRFVIVAEDDFIQNIEEIGVPSDKILSMQDKRFDHASIPFDPIGQGNRVMSVELAKAIMTTVQLIRSEMEFGDVKNVKAIFPIEESDLINKLGIVWENTRAKDGILLLTDFRAPNFPAVSRNCKRVLELQVDRITKKIALSSGGEEWGLERILETEGGLAISARFEMDQVEKFSLSSQFAGFVATLATSRSITILTEPVGLSPCPYLVAASSNI